MISKKHLKHSFYYVFYLILFAVVFFSCLEAAQRIRYWHRFRSDYWLKYGFVKKPANYANMLSKGVQSQTRKLDIIENPLIMANGYSKYNPKFINEDFSINSQGFRGKEFNVIKAPNTIRIVALGGSTTFGTGAPDGYTYPEYLEKILNKNTKKTYEVINAGVGSMNIERIGCLYDAEVSQWDPDIIIINSMFNNLYFSRATQGEANTILQKISHFLVRRSLFYMTLREKIAIIMRKPIGDFYRASLEQIKENFENDQELWNEIADLFRIVIKSAKDHGTKVVLIKQPVNLVDSNKEKTWILLDRRLSGVYETAYEQLETLAEEENIMIIDVAEKFRKTENARAYFTDGLHLTPKGNELMAGFIAEAIVTGKGDSGLQ